VLATFFVGLAASLDPARAPRQPLTIQWDFDDADPWLVRVENGSTRAEPGRAEAADLTFSCRFEDWVDTAVGRVDANVQLLRRRLRPSSMTMLWRCRHLFEPSA
jgi:alkyl sulfatase BDS1-like metallo-beta-lactamase superfamily hydrolase